VISSEASTRRANRDARWAQKREHLLAAAAAGFHVMLFAYNLAFWGFEGTAPDRWVSEKTSRISAARAVGCGGWRLCIPAVGNWAGRWRSSSAF